MDDTDPAPTAAGTSHPQPHLPHRRRRTSHRNADPLIALGERIVAELGDPRTNNTLDPVARPPHRPADPEADTAREAGAADADTREAEAHEAILQLWQARSDMASRLAPSPAPPRSRGCSTTCPAWTTTGMVPADNPGAPPGPALPHPLGPLDLVTGDDADVEQAWLTRFGDMLTPDEARLLRRAAARPRRIDLLLRWCERGSDDKTKAPVDEDNAGEHDATPTHPLLRLADAYHGTIADLIRPRTPGAARDGNPDVNT